MFATDLWWMYMQAWIYRTLLFWRYSCENTSLAKHLHHFFSNSIEIPSRGWKFNGSSLITYRTQFRRPIQTMILDIAFNARDINGSMIFASRYSNGTGPYLFVQLKDKSIEFGLSTGTHNVLVRCVKDLKWLNCNFFTSSSFIRIDLLNRLAWTNGIQSKWSIMQFMIMLLCILMENLLLPKFWRYTLVSTVN